MRVGLVGCGLIGNRRARVVSESADDDLVIVADVDMARAVAVAQTTSCEAASDWRDVTEREDLDIIIVSTPNMFLMPVAVSALARGKHVLCEKPLGRNSAEAQLMVDAARKAKVVLKTGFNHRHHPAIRKAHELCSQGVIGKPMFVRAVYGHGGRPGYHKEWRGDPELAGGGELLDQGVHIIDLCRWFLGEFTHVTGCTVTSFWDLGYLESSHPPAPGDSGRRRLEDNAFVTMQTADERVAQFHTSWTQWKNRFSFEVLGRDGYALVNGLGGSYGTESLTIGQRRPEGGVPTEEILEYPGADLSWNVEWEHFRQAIQEGRDPLGSAADGLGAMRLIDAIYESARTGEVVQVAP